MNKYFVYSRQIATNFYPLKSFKVKMISRKEQLLLLPWEIQRFENHRLKVQHARPAVDIKTPRVHSHIVTKRKKIQTENERLENIKKENVRLLQKLCDIMGTRRLTNIWTYPRPNFLQRQKIFPSRPITCKEKSKELIQHSEDEKILFPPKRCQTCYGTPYNKQTSFYEDRIPWKPPSKTWNNKIATNQFEFLRGGRHCYTYHLK
ncbi:C17orf105 family protein [Megaselia abdita]